MVQSLPVVVILGTLTMTYSLPLAARKLGVSQRTIMRWEKQGKIPPIPRSNRNNARVLTPRDLLSIQEWMTSTYVPQSHAA